MRTYRIHRGIAFLALALAFAVTHCRRDPIGRPSPDTPVILISVDTLRSDHLPAYGYEGVETPNIDALRADSILFSRAYSHVPLTLPSHVSILTGLLPADHGVRDNVGFRLASSVPTLQELLKKNGYATGGAVSAFVLRKETGISRGFDFFDDAVAVPSGAGPTQDPALIGSGQRDGMQTMRSLERWIDGVKGKPFFAFLHLYEPHTPYTPPQPFSSRYSNPYDGEIAYADSIVGELIRFLKEKGLYERSLVVFLSDHGEGLYDHGEEEHGIFLYREDLQVPLLVKLPEKRQAGVKVDTPVGLVDVFPTILDRTATPMPGKGHRVGQSLLTVPGGGPQRLLYAETYYPRFHYGWSDLHSLIEGNDHYIRAPQEELFDLAADPAEKKNLLEQNRRATVRLRDAIEPFVHAVAAPSSVSREEAAGLAALGYLGSTVTTGAGDVLPDPKTTIGVSDDIRQAFTWFRDGREAEALSLTDRLLEANPRITDLWDLKYKILNKMGRPVEAVEAAKAGLRRTATSVALLFDVANGAFELGDLDSAQRHAEIAAGMEPGEAHEILARVWARRGNVQKSEEEAKLSAETSPNPVGALMILAVIEKDRGNLAKSLEYLDRAVDGERGAGQREGLHLMRGDVLARLDRLEEAEREFRTEIRIDPKAPDAYASLIMLLATERRLNDATTVVFDAVKASDTPRTYAVIAESLKAIGDDRGAMFWTYQGLKRFPDDEVLRDLPRRLAKATPLLQQRRAN